MASQLFLISLVVQCTATLFLSLVFLIVYQHSRQGYFAYWTAGWCALGIGLLALLVYFLMLPNYGPSWPLLALYHASPGVTAILAFFARYAFRSGRRVTHAAWLIFLPVVGYLVLTAILFPGVGLVSTLPRHSILAMALWASGALFWQAARRDKMPGAGVLSVSFAAWGVQQARYAAGFLLFETQPAALHGVSLVDTALIISVALGMILFALENDRERLRESNRKLEVSEQRLKDLAMRDPLTGLFNRRHFDHVAPQLEAHARRLRYHIAIFVVDLNFFKQTNDREGHLRGDQVLRAFGEFLRRETRAADLPFRWGGDEFLVLMMDLAPERIQEKAEQLRERWNEVRVELRSEVTVAVGWALFGDLYGEDGLEGAIRRADSRMYCDKRGSRGGNVPTPVQV
jgi:diguanylate cyclase (GGDEF)-like protein